LADFFGLFQPAELLLSLVSQHLGPRPELALITKEIGHLPVQPVELVRQVADALVIDERTLVLELLDLLAGRLQRRHPLASAGLPVVVPELTRQGLAKPPEGRGP